MLAEPAKIRHFPLSAGFCRLGARAAHPQGRSASEGRAALAERCAGGLPTENKARQGEPPSPRCSLLVLERSATGAGMVATGAQPARLRLLRHFGDRRRRGPVERLGPRSGRGEHQHVPGRSVLPCLRAGRAPRASRSHIGDLTPPGSSGSGDDSRSRCRGGLGLCLLPRNSLR